MAKGKKTGGRTRGTPNRITQETRDVFKRIVERCEDKAEEWLLRTAEGEPVPMVKKDGDVFRPVLDQAGNEVMIRMGADPGKAYDLLLKTNEFFKPKLARTEVTLDQVGDDELLAEIRRRQQAKAPEPPAAEESIQ